ncbi:transcription initiation factor TFIID subunit 4-like [Strigops habroptila]|uniref:transcription initiation factor TFIID subunit 4-like n=1 Tax=Strigops habroptila TaxID=2489341 RepID=UPI0011CED818|nr:transcription initiation factor TFIID subunit 4-like [Strigops habroptila]
MASPWKSERARVRGGARLTGLLEGLRPLAAALLAARSGAAISPAGGGQAAGVGRSPAGRRAGSHLHCSPLRRQGTAGPVTARGEISTAPGPAVGAGAEPSREGDATAAARLAAQEEVLPRLLPPPGPGGRERSAQSLPEAARPPHSAAARKQRYRDKVSWGSRRGQPRPRGPGRLSPPRADPDPARRARNHPRVALLRGMLRAFGRWGLTARPPSTAPRRAPPCSGGTDGLTARRSGQRPRSIGRAGGCRGCTGAGPGLWKWRGPGRALAGREVSAGLAGTGRSPCGVGCGCRCEQKVGAVDKRLKLSRELRFMALVSAHRRTSIIMPSSIRF